MLQNRYYLFRLLQSTLPNTLFFSGQLIFSLNKQIHPINLNHMFDFIKDWIKMLIEYISFEYFVASVYEYVISVNIAVPAIFLI